MGCNNPLINAKLVSREKFTSVQKVQAGVTKLLQDAETNGNYYRVMRNNEPIGVLIPNDLWDEFQEDLEMMSSPTFLKSIEEAKKSKVFYTSDQIREKYGLK